MDVDKKESYTGNHTREKQIRSIVTNFIVNFPLREINVSINKTCVSNTDAEIKRFIGLYLRSHNLI